MKKEYIKPEIQVCHLEGQLMMLTSSKEKEQLKYYEEDLPEDENEYMY